MIYNNNKVYREIAFPKKYFNKNKQFGGIINFNNNQKLKKTVYKKAPLNKLITKNNLKYRLINKKQNDKTTEKLKYFFNRRLISKKILLKNIKGKKKLYNFLFQILINSIYHKYGKQKLDKFKHRLHLRSNKLDKILFNYFKKKNINVNIKKLKKYRGRFLYNFGKKLLENKLKKQPFNKIIREAAVLSNKYTKLYYEVKFNNKKTHKQNLFTNSLIKIGWAGGWSYNFNQIWHNTNSFIRSIKRLNHIRKWWGWWYTRRKKWRDVKNRWFHSRRRKRPGRRFNWAINDNSPIYNGKDYGNILIQKKNTVKYWVVKKIDKKRKTKLFFKYVNKNKYYFNKWVKKQIFILITWTITKRVWAKKKDYFLNYYVYRWIIDSSTRNNYNQIKIAYYKSKVPIINIIKKKFLFQIILLAWLGTKKIINFRKIKVRKARFKPKFFLLNKKKKFVVKNNTKRISQKSIRRLLCKKLLAYKIIIINKKKLFRIRLSIKRSAKYLWVLRQYRGYRKRIIAPRFLRIFFFTKQIGFIKTYKKSLLFFKQKYSKLFVKKRYWNKQLDIKYRKLIIRILLNNITMHNSKLLKYGVNYISYFSYWQLLNNKVFNIKRYFKLTYYNIQFVINTKLQSRLVNNEVLYPPSSLINNSIKAVSYLKNHWIRAKYPQTPVFFIYHNEIVSLISITKVKLLQYNKNFVITVLNYTSNRPGALYLNKNSNKLLDNKYMVIIGVYKRLLKKIIKASKLKKLKNRKRYLVKLSKFSKFKTQLEKYFYEYKSKLSARLVGGYYKKNLIDLINFYYLLGRPKENTIFKKKNFKNWFFVTNSFKKLKKKYNYFWKKVFKYGRLTNIKRERKSLFKINFPLIRLIRGMYGPKLIQRDIYGKLKKKWVCSSAQIAYNLLYRKKYLFNWDTISLVNDKTIKNYNTSNYKNFFNSSSIKRWKKIIYKNKYY